MKRFLAILISILIITSIIPQNVFASENSSNNGVFIVNSIDELTSDHQYSNNENLTWVYTYEGAAELNVVFSDKTSLENGADYIYLYDKNDNQIGNRFTGNKLSGATVNIPGDTVKIKLVSDETNTDYGFSVDNVIPMDRIIISNLPTNTKYYIGQDPNFSGLKVQGIFKDETEKEISSEYKLSDIDNTLVGKQTVSVTYNGLETEFEIEYVEPVISKIEISQLPQITNYYYGDNCELSIEGLILKAKDEYNNEFEIKKGYTTSNFDCDSLGKQEIEVTYKGQKTTFEINVIQSTKYKEYSTSITITGLANSNISNLKIPETINSKPVTIIANNAFENTNIISVELPDTISSIGNYAFRNCEKLKNINIPEVITTINVCAFYGCSSLEKITLPENITSIENNAFENCKKLNRITIPSKVEKIGEYAFSGCSEITGEIEVPNSVKNIGLGAFKGTQPTSMKLPFVGASRTSTELYGVFGYIFGYKATYNSTTIEDCVFQFTARNSNYNAPLGQDFIYYHFYIPKTLEAIELTDAKNIPDRAFYNCGTLESITTNNGFNNVGAYSFYNCSKLSAFSINDETTVISQYAFYGCSSLEKIALPEKITSIENNAFENCKKLNRITIPSKVEKIGEYAFSGCSEITGEIEVPNSVKNIGLGAFKGTQPTSMKLPFVGASRTSTELYGVFGYIFGYKTNYNGKAIEGYVLQFSGRNPISSAPLDQYNIYYHFSIPQTLTSVEITDATRMPDRAFYNCGTLESITTNNGFNNVGAYSFYNCSKLSTFSINDETTVISQYAFYGCSSLEKITLPEKITSIENNAFENCKKLNRITIPSKVEKIGEYAFSGCSEITGEIEVPNSVKNIGLGAFKGTQPTSMKLPFVGVSRTSTELYGVFGYIFGYKATYNSTTIEDCVFQFTALNSNYNVSSGQYYIYYHFYIPKTLTSVEITDATRIPDRAFYNCSMLNYVQLPDSLETIGNNCFYNVSGDFILRANKNTVGYTYAETNNIPHSSTDKFTLNTNNIVLYRNGRSTIFSNVIMYNGKVDNNPNIIWSSSNTNVASVNNGVISAVAPGTATITAQCDDKIRTVKVNVYFKLQSIVFTQGTVNIDIGSSKRLYVNYNPYNTTDSKDLTYLSSDESVATISESGIVTAKSKGTTTITARGINGVTTECKVNVLVPIDSLTLDKNQCTINKTETLKLNAVVSPTNTTDTLSWTSSNTSIAIVDSNGLVTPYRSGEVTITVKSSRGKTATCVVNILSPATKISFNNSEYDIFVGCKKQLIAALEPYDVTDIITKWETSNEAVVTVANDGTIEAVGQGSAIITVTTSNGKEAKCTVNVENDITQAQLVKHENSVDYSGYQRYISFDIMYNDCALTQGKHYIVRYRNNVNAGTATVDIVGAEKATGSFSFDFEINKLELNASNAVYETQNSQYIYTGDPILCSGELYFGLKKLSKNDYTLDYKNNTTPGIATVIISGQGNYYGKIEQEYIITPRNINDVEITLNNSFEYTGDIIEPDANIVFNGKSLEKGKDYSLVYQNNVNVGEATVTIYGEGCFIGEVHKTFEIIPKTADSLSCSLSQCSYVYDGNSHSPFVTIKDGEIVLEAYKDYKVDYFNNIFVGTAEVRVTLIGNYSGVISDSFVINPIDMSNSKVELIKYEFDYKKDISFTPDVIVSNESIKYNLGSYDVEYIDNNKVGTAKAVVKFKGNYSGTITTDFYIYPTVNKNNVTIFKGCKERIKVTSNSGITYKSSNPKIVKVDKQGLITGVKKGNAKIIVTSNNQTKTIDVAVKNPYLSKNKATVFYGDKVKLKVIGGNGKIKWSSNKKSIATVKNGKIKTKKKGTVIIKAKRNGITMKCKVTVKGPSIIIPSFLVLHKGDTKKIPIKKNPKKMKVKWISSNKKIVKVKNGRITGKAKGDAKITAIGIYKGKKYKATCYISVKKQKAKVYDIGDYRIGIKKVIKTRFNNQNLLIVTYYFENNSSSSNDFNWAIVDTLYQNGIELDRAYPVGLSGYNSSNQFREILPGASLNVQVAYKLRNTRSQVKATLRELFDSDYKNMVTVRIGL